MILKTFSSLTLRIGTTVLILSNYCVRPCNKTNKPLLENCALLFPSDPFDAYRKCSDNRLQKVLQNIHDPWRALALLTVVCQGWRSLYLPRAVWTASSTCQQNCHSGHISDNINGNSIVYNNRNCHSSTSLKTTCISDSSLLVMT